jgi:hypothetical protein
VYELLLRLVSMDHVDLALKKKAIDPVFVRQLMLLFDSEDPRERCAGGGREGYALRFERPVKLNQESVLHLTTVLCFRLLPSCAGTT